MMKVLVVFGTRPEAIKMAPVIKVLAASDTIRPVVCLTGQHREMLAGILDFFGIEPTYDLSIMKPEQDLVYITMAVLSGLQRVLAIERPDCVLVHGDTTTAMASSLSAFYAGYPIGHVEAGLRTGNLRQPWPEEMNRCVVDRLAEWLFAPTASARGNLLKENLASKIFVTGNTVVDALLAVRAALENNSELRRRADSAFGFLDPARRLILVTGHRRESFGRGFEEICMALRRIAQRTDVQIVYPVHLNPAVQAPVRRILADLPNVHLLEPLDYVPFVSLMMRSHIILTDSGGIQEEAPSLGKPVLVMREVTERPEAIASGTVALVGADALRIEEGVVELLDSSARYATFARGHNPYGDGLASLRIRDALLGTSSVIVDAIAAGRQPPDLTAHRLIRTVDLPIAWTGTEAAIRPRLTEAAYLQSEPPILKRRRHARWRRNAAAKDRLRFAFVRDKAGNARVLRARPENTGTPGLAG